MTRFEEMARQLAELNVELRHQMEQAEATVSRANDLIRQLDETGLLSRRVWLGKAWEYPHDPEFPPEDSIRAIQAALLAPEGFGVCTWDVEEAHDLNARPEDFVPNARMNFLAFDECEPAWKALLLPHIDEMLEELTEIALVAASRMEPEPSVSAEEFFGGPDADGDRGS